MLIGFSHPMASFFLLRSQKKETKEKAARMPLVSCASRFQREVIEGASCPSITAIHP
jgi:hypothetical protein